ncbi:hypothetical protein AA106556_1877 [Neokomagataea tanensis NBRC 106556]|uniref:Uncharacterized protein n=1 Tax=Neokomagataea tanensis NBRC 106556 TaxID=1223519 RepID=A0ABQ0QL51_9PROT|nr:hypothetical protein AA106556_1877 [Neokomagataea tanensis NBRC 106556]
MNSWNNARNSFGLRARDIVSLAIPHHPANFSQLVRGYIEHLKLFALDRENTLQPMDTTTIEELRAMTGQAL